MCCNYTVLLVTILYSFTKAQMLYYSYIKVPKFEVQLSDFA